jgi:hypothetical protein
MKTLTLLLILVPCYARSQQCGSDMDRWPEKILNNGSKLSTVSVFTTIAEENALPLIPKGGWRKHPRYSNELTLDSLRGTVIMAGEEDDNDFHLVLIDNAGDSMIIEIPSPDDCPEVSTHKEEYRIARAKAESLFGVITSQSIHCVPRKDITAVGYGFFDKKGHGKGHSRNGREIHPVLRIE